MKLASHSPNDFWLTTDIAIEIINKMLAEQIQGLNELLEAYNNTGFSEEDEVVSSDKNYTGFKSKITMYSLEIRQLYSGKNVNQVLKKINMEYAPYLRAKYSEFQYA